MLVKNAVCFLVLTALFSFSACSLKQVSKEAPAVNEVVKNTKFKINLPEDHTTGNLWELSHDFDKTVVEDLNAVWHGNQKGIDFNFQAIAAGQTTLTLVLRNYKDTLNVKSFIVKTVNN